MLAMIATTPTDISAARAAIPTSWTALANDWRLCRTSASLSAKAGRSWYSMVGMRLASAISSRSMCSVISSNIFGSCEA